MSVWKDTLRQLYPKLAEALAVLGGSVWVALGISGLTVYCF